MENKKWNTNETMPELERDVIFITYDGEVLNISDKLYIIERPFKEKNTYCSFKMTVTHTEYGWTENNTTHEELDIPYELNDKILSMVKDFYTEKKKELDKRRNELIDRYVEDLKTATE